MKPHLPENLGLDARGAVDLDNLPCTGCRYRAAEGTCRLMPPIFAPSIPVKMPNGSVAMSQGGWAFPPALTKCGQFKEKPSPLLA